MVCLSSIFLGIIVSTFGAELLQSDYFIVRGRQVARARRGNHASDHHRHDGHIKQQVVGAAVTHFDCGCNESHTQTRM